VPTCRAIRSTRDAPDLRFGLAEMLLKEFSQLIEP
jgi:hypothetical protein